MKSPDDSTINQKPLVNIFWTGGWDSTFRIISLANKEIIIQPYYLKDNRKSELHELTAINFITKELQSRSSTRCIIREVITMKTSDIEKDAEIADAWYSVSKKCHIGSQYEWLARFAKNIKEIELCIEINGNTHNAIKACGTLKKITSDVIGNYYVLDPTESTRELTTLLGNFRFPIIDKSKREMKRETENSGYIEIMNKTWFCHTPVKGKPCGICIPCKVAVKSGMSYRLGLNALRRNMIMRVKHRIFGNKATRN